MSASIKWCHLDRFKVLARNVSPFTVVAEIMVSPKYEIANPQGMEVFAVKKHGLPEKIVCFCCLYGMHSSPLVFAPNCAFVRDPL